MDGALSYRRSMAALLAAGLLAIAIPSHADEAADQAALLKAEQDWLKATEAGNRAALERLLHPSFVNISPLGACATGWNRLRQARRHQAPRKRSPS